MTASGDFLPMEDEQLQVGPTYPTAFGLELNPRVQGIGIAVLGLLGAFAIYNFLVRPVQVDRAALDAEVSQLQAQVDQQRASLQGLAELQAQLDTAIQRRVAVYDLLGTSRSLDTLLLDINQQIQNSNAAISDVLRADFDRLDQGQLAALGLNPAQIRQVRAEFAGDPAIQRQLYTSKLVEFTPNPITPLQGGPEVLSTQINQQTVNVSMDALFPQTLSIMRNIERLEPLIIIREVQQDIAPLPSGVSEDQVPGLTRLLTTQFTLDVLVPAIDPATPPPPPPPPEPAEGEAPADGTTPPPEGG